jgi:hypothetical protein
MTAIALLIDMSLNKLSRNGEKVLLCPTDDVFFFFFFLNIKTGLLFESELAISHILRALFIGINNELYIKIKLKINWILFIEII